MSFKPTQTRFKELHTTLFHTCFLPLCSLAEVTGGRVASYFRLQLLPSRSQWNTPELSMRFESHLLAMDIGYTTYLRV